MKHLKFGDIIVIVLVITAALGIGLLFTDKAPAENLYAEIYVDGEKINEISLHEAKNQKMNITHGDLSFIVDIKDGKIAITDIDCPDQVCVKTGHIGQNGQVIACVPNRVVIKTIAHNEKGEIDIVVG